MGIVETKDTGRVREASTHKANREIDQITLESIREHSTLSDPEITQRLRELSREWDVEKTLEVNASSLAPTGLILGSFSTKGGTFFLA